MANRGSGGFSRGGRGQNCGRGRGGRNPNGRNNVPAGNNSGGQGTSKPKCQICDKPNHTALECWYRFEEDFQPSKNNKIAGYTAAYVVDTNWYADSGASDHITSELDKLKCGRSMEDVIKFILPMGQVCILAILVILLYTPLCEICILKMFYMFQKHIKILLLFTVLPPTIMSSLNFIQNFSSLRIRQRRQLFIEEDVKEVSIP
jgi:hypothetical protein